MIVFTNDEQGFAEWRDRTPNGYVVNVAPAGQASIPTRLHRLPCPHLDPPLDPKEQWRLTARPKACSTDVDALRAWASAHGHELTSCKTCRPDEARRSLQ